MNSCGFKQISLKGLSPLVSHIFVHEEVGILSSSASTLRYEALPIAKQMGLSNSSGGGWGWVGGKCFLNFCPNNKPFQLLCLLPELAIIKRCHLLLGTQTYYSINWFPFLIDGMMDIYTYFIDIEYVVICSTHFYLTQKATSIGNKVRLIRN